MCNTAQQIKMKIYCVTWLQRSINAVERLEDLSGVKAKMGVIQYGCWYKWLDVITA